MNENNLPQTDSAPVSARPQIFGTDIGEIIPSVLNAIIAFIAPAFDPKYLPFWLSVSGAGLVVFATQAIYKLFANSLGVDEITASLSAFSSVGILSVLLVIVVMTDKNAVKGMGYLIMAVWTLVTFSLVALGSMLISNKMLEVPEALIGIGRTVAGLLPALALVPIITMVIAFYNNTLFPTAAAAAGHYFGFVLKMVMVGASTMANVSFGLSRSMPPEVAVLCGFLLESLFMWSLFKLLTATHKKDQFDIIVWSVMLVTTGSFLGFVGVETVSTLSKLTIPVIARMQEIGALIYVSAIGLSFALTIIAQLTTSLIDWVPSAHQVKVSIKSTAGFVSGKAQALRPNRVALAADSLIEEPKIKELEISDPK